jgi:hypothetical protein
MSRFAPHLFLLTALAAVGAQSPTDHSELAPDALLAPFRIGAPGPHGAFVDDADVIRGEGEPYRATFVDGAELEVAGGDSGASPARLRLRFAGAHRGGERLACDAAARPALAGDLVQWRHGSVTERYELRASGFEQSFVFATRPHGSGDLAVEIAASGNVTAPATTRAVHQPLHWRSGDRDAIRYGEAFAFDRRGQRIEIATAYDGAGRITLVVPAAFVDTATFPLTVDPAVGPVFLPAGSADSDSQPSVAYDPITDRYLVVWRRVVSSVASIRGAVYAGDGTVLNPLITIGTGVVGRDLREPVACLCRSLDPDAFVVAWTEENTGVGGSGPAGIFARVVNSLGNPLAPSFRVNTTTGSVDDQPTISGPDGAILVAWRSASTNTVIRMRDLYWTNPTNPASVSSGPERVIDTATGTDQVRNPQLAPNNARVTSSGVTMYANRIVWERFHASPSPGQADVWTMSFQVGNSPANFLTIAAPAVVPGANSPTANEINPSIAARASAWQDPGDLQFLVAWQDNTIVLGQMFTMAGPTGGTIVIRNSPTNAAQPAVAAGQTEFTVAYVEQIGGLLDLDVYAARVLADGTVAQDHRLVDNPGAVLQSSLAVTSQPLPVAGQPLRNTTLLAWTGRTGPASGIDDIRARFYEPVVGSGILFGVGCAGPGGSLPSINGTGGAPTPGNSAFAITLSNAPPVSLCALLVGAAPTAVPIPGTADCYLFADLPFITILPAISDLAGSAVLPLPLPLDIPLSPIYMQWGVYTPGWNAFGWITSDDVDMAWSD